MTTNANNKVQTPFECFQIAQWSSFTSGSHTVTAQILGPSGLTSADVWMEVEYLGSGSTPLGSLVSTAPATQLTAGSALTSSSNTWSTPGANVAYQLQATFTPAMAGLVRATIKVGKASTTIYVDPKLVIA